MTFDISARLAVPPRPAAVTPGPSGAVPGTPVSPPPGIKGRPAGPDQAPDMAATERAEALTGLANSASAAKQTEDDPQKRGQDVRQAVQDLQEMVQQVRRNLEFSVDTESGREVIKVIDSETDQVIRQIPPEEVLRISRHFKESLGALIRTEA